MPIATLDQIARARSGDKGAGANIGVVARNQRAYDYLAKALTADRVRDFFREFNPKTCVRYELPNLGALNFVLTEILDGGGSLSLRIDAQGKALGQALLSMTLEIPAELLGDSHG